MLPKTPTHEKSPNEHEAEDLPLPVLGELATARHPSLCHVLSLSGGTFGQILSLTDHLLGRLGDALGGCAHPLCRVQTI